MIDTSNTPALPVKVPSVDTFFDSYLSLYGWDDRLGTDDQAKAVFSQWLNRYQQEPESTLRLADPEGYYGHRFTRTLFHALGLTMPNNEQEALRLLQNDSPVAGVDFNP